MQLICQQMNGTNTNNIIADILPNGSLGFYFKETSDLLILYTVNQK